MSGDKTEPREDSTCVLCRKQVKKGETFCLSCNNNTPYPYKIRKKKRR